VASRRRPWRLCLGAALALPVLLTGCASRSAQASLSPAGAGHAIRVVAAENFWGSIAAQIGGDHAQVTSIITNPNADPHSYEPTAPDARTLAAAQLVIENGIGYDPWVPKLLGADQGHPTVLDVGRLLGVPAGGNPHRWYNPDDVRAVIQQITTDLQTIDPADSSYFASQKTSFETVALRPYQSAIAAIKARHAGTPVGASESIFAMLAPALGLRLITPYSFLKAISEGTDVSAADKQTIDEQIKQHAIKIYVYNSQNVTPDIQTQLAEVKAEHIPYAIITETLTPSTVTFQTWQTRQLVGIEAALAAASA
jgi:zinc/manganese transport system substrate-binding protein